MNYEKAEAYAYQEASNEFGSDVKAKIFNKPISSALGHLRYAMRTIKFLTDFFETQNLASKEENYDFIKEMNEHVKITIDGDEKQNMRGLKTNLHQFFWLMEFRRDPDKKIAIALFLKHYLEYLRKNIKHITVQEFLTIYDEIDLDAKYFDKEYVFGELITVVSDELK